MSDADDGWRARLDRVAGVSLRPPGEAYRVDGLSFGEAILSRDLGSGRWASLTLTLTLDAADRSRKAGGSEATRVSFPMQHALVQREDASDVGPGVRGLLVDHELLSRPAWLTSPALEAPPSDDAALGALDRLRAALCRATGRAAMCPVCERAPVGGGRQNVSMSLLFKLGLHIGMTDEPVDAAAAECPHAPMRREALGALWAAFPELAFEAVLLLVAASAMRPPRFVLSTALMPWLLGSWLMNRQPTRYASWARPAPDAAETSALALSARVWRFEATPGVVAPAEGAGSDPAPALSTRPSPPAVTLLWPDGVARPEPPQVEAAPPTTAKRHTAPKGAPKEPLSAPAEHPAQPDPPSPGQEMMTAELRALGYTDARIKRLVADGSLERAGYGWFRWRVAPPAP